MQYCAGVKKKTKQTQKNIYKFKEMERMRIDIDEVKLKQFYKVGQMGFGFLIMAIGLFVMTGVISRD